MISKHFLNALKHRAYIAYQHLKSGDFNSIIKGFVAHIYSNETSYGLELFPDTLTANQLAENSLRIRHFNLEDINVLKENMRHIRLVEEEIPTCYIAETKNHVPVFRQWVFKSTENERIQNYFGPIFPNLNNNEALLEGGFTHPNHRGQSIMAKSILNIMNLDAYKNTKRFITFVDIKNIASLKGLNKAGFRPYVIRNEKWFLFNRKVTFTPISSEVKQDYCKLISVA